MVKINGERWTIKFVSPYHPKLKTPNHSYTLGSCDNITQTIYINEYIAPDQIIKVLRHELTHAVFKSYNIRLEPKIKEEVADFIATYNDIITEKLKEILKEEGIV